jgi:MFS family permease
MSWIYIGKMLFYVSTALSGIVGSMISGRIGRVRLLELWIFSGILITALFAVFQGLTVYLILSLSLGFSFGIGFPSCMAFIVEGTTIEERARVFGISMLLMFVIFVLTYFTAYMVLVLGVMEWIFLCIILRITGFFALRLSPYKGVTRKGGSWLSVFRTKGYLLYFFPWLMFNLATGVQHFLESWLRQSYIFQSIAMLGFLLQYLGMLIFAFISGFVGDRFGRRNAIIFGLITLGVSYAFLSLATSSTSYLITKIISGMAWGFIAPNILTVLGDLASTGSKEKFFAIGGIVPLIVNSVFQWLSNVIFLTFDSSILSSVLSMTLFISVFPLLYAPETLPEEKIRARRFREYLKNVRRLVEGEKPGN